MASTNIHEKRTAFSSFVNSTAAAVLLNTRATEVYLATMARTVYGVIERLLADVEQLQPKFKVQELLKVGSFHEGTKILEADEFDFLAVLKELSEPGVLNIDEQPRNHLPSRTRINHVEVKPNSQIKRRWPCTETTGHLMNFLDVKSPLSFGKAVLDVIKAKAAAQNIAFKETSPSSIAFSKTPLPLQSMDGTPLFLDLVQVLSPNVMLRFETAPPRDDDTCFDRSSMSIDLSPAIRYHRPQDCFDPALCGDAKLADTVLKRGSILLVNQRSPAQFKVTYTETEIEYMRDRMQQGHKGLYVFLKHCNGLVYSVIDGVIGKLTSSYMLKTACIYHDLVCHDDDPNCFLSVLSTLCMWYDNRFVPSVFNTRQNLNTGELDEGRMSDHVEELLCALFLVFWKIYTDDRSRLNLSDYNKFFSSCIDSARIDTASKFEKIKHILKMAKGTDASQRHTLDQRVLVESRTFHP